MFKKIAILMCLTLMLSAPVLAELTKINIPMSIDFLSMQNFNLQWEGGSRNYNWNTSQHSDDSFDMVVYQDLNLTDIVCDEEINRFDNLTHSMVDVMSICGRLADNNNASIIMELSDTKYSHGLQTEKLDTCKDNLAVATSQASKYVVCETQRQKYKNDWDDCSTDLTEMEKSSKSNPFLWFIGGVLIVFGWQYFTKRKDTTSEEQDEGIEE